MVNCISHRFHMVPSSVSEFHIHSDMASCISHQPTTSLIHKITSCVYPCICPIWFARCHLAGTQQMGSQFFVTVFHCLLGHKASPVRRGICDRGVMHTDPSSPKRSVWLAPRCLTFSAPTVPEARTTVMAPCSNALVLATV